jgi:hypothetical protein
MTDDELLAYRTEASRLLAAMVDLEADRDRARDAAVALEQENARLVEAEKHVRALHAPNEWGNCGNRCYSSGIAPQASPCPTILALDGGEVR